LTLGCGAMARRFMTPKDWRGSSQRDGPGRPEEGRIAVIVRT
jgi:hypothetical protein